MPPYLLRCLLLTHGGPNVRISNISCPSCIQEKQSRAKIPKKRTSRETSAVLELVHTDVRGPFKVKSLRGALYFLIFVDDFSRKTGYTSWGIRVSVLKSSGRFNKKLKIKVKHKS